MFDKGIWKDFFPMQKDAYHREILMLHKLYVAFGILLVVVAAISTIFFLSKDQLGEKEKYGTSQPSQYYNHEDSLLVIVFKGDSTIIINSAKLIAGSATEALGEIAGGIAGEAIDGAAVLVGALGYAKGKLSIIDKLYLNLDSLVVNYTYNNIGNNNNSINTINKSEGQNKDNTPKVKPAPRKKPIPSRKKHRSVTAHKCNCCKCIRCCNKRVCESDSSCHNNNLKVNTNDE